eukprot:GSChrysophyteH2.ASY1.ANO1.119.1 assembled CDS
MAQPRQYQPQQYTHQPQPQQPQPQQPQPQQQQPQQYQHFRPQPHQRYQSQEQRALGVGKEEKLHGTQSNTSKGSSLSTHMQTKTSAVVTVVAAAAASDGSSSASPSAGASTASNSTAQSKNTNMNMAQARASGGGKSARRRGSGSAGEHATKHTTTATSTTGKVLSTGGSADETATALDNIPTSPSHPSRQQSVTTATTTTLPRRELVESPGTKSSQKEFLKTLRLKERSSALEAEAYAKHMLSRVQPSVQWCIYLELADFAKRRNDLDQARENYRLVCEAQPLAVQGWLDWSKLEEECGRFAESLKILRRGLHRCHFNETLLTKAVKQQERLNMLKDARSMLSVLKYESIDKVWRAVLEGALLEVRAGRLAVARQLLKFLMQNVPWYGPIYFEAYKLEEKNGSMKAAVDVVRKGLAELPRYGPLWFGLFKMLEHADIDSELSSYLYGRTPRLERMRAEVSTSVLVISRELVWKVHFEHSQALSRAADASAFGLMTMSILACPLNLRWKIWLVGARLEVSAGRISCARRLLCQALAEAPPKTRCTAYLECSRLEEYVGNVDLARRILQHACEEVPHEWKTSLELTLLEARAGRLLHATRLARQSLYQHPGTGRIWALYVQLCHQKPPSKHDALLNALRNVPKSGEVWAEGARCRLNPLRYNCFDLGGAQKFLGFAIQFTPQYGDTFLELLRVEVLAQVILPRVRCINADPNYGTLWDFNRMRPCDTPADILKSTLRNSIAHEMLLALPLYVRACVFYVRDCCIKYLGMKAHKNGNTQVMVKANTGTTLDSPAAASSELEQQLRQEWADLLQDFTEAEHENATTKEGAGTGAGECDSDDVASPDILVELPDGNVFAATDFITGLIEVNRATFSSSANAELRKRVLYDTDSLVS